MLYFFLAAFSLAPAGFVACLTPMAATAEASELAEKQTRRFEATYGCLNQPSIDIWLNCFGTAPGLP